ncbi:MAG: nthA [Chloroflexi bacterium]|nr:nthA [Chloroflexota bacterium]
MAEDHHEHHHHDDQSPAAIRVKALESLLIEKGIVSTDAIDAVVETYENDIGPMNGARVVAHAWVDPDYRARLLTDGTGAIAELGFWGSQGAEIVVLENTRTVQNMVVCTLCSCYPWPVLGLPPTWYKSAAYRSRAVLEPRQVLREMGLDLEESVEVRVWDSTAETRYMVLPERPAGTEKMNEDELVALVSRDSMVGVARVREPAAVR